MAASSSFIAVDLGAQSGRVVVGTFAVDGFTLTEAHRFANVPITMDGVLCWDAERLFDDTLVGLAKAVEQLRAGGADLLGIAVDSWGVDYGLVNGAGALVAPVRHYRANTADVVNVANHRVPSAEAYSRTGIVELSINTCYQLVRDAEAGLLASRPTVLLTPDLWTYWLTGVRGAERTIASTTGLVDRRTGAWADDLARRWGIPLDVLPDLADTGSIAGPTTPEVTRRIGAQVPVTVYRAAAHDTASAFAAVVSAGDASGVISCGTWALVGCSATAPVLTDEARSQGFTNEIGADDSTVLIRNLSGTWLLEECLREWAEQDGTTEVRGLRATLLEEAGALESSGVLIDPGSAELIERGRMPDRLAELVQRAGGTATQSRAQIVRLILDSLAVSFGESVAAAGRLSGNECERIHMIGGGSQIALLVRLTQEASGLPVLVGHTEATSIGNICVQAVAAGRFPDLATARKAIT